MGFSAYAIDEPSPELRENLIRRLWLDHPRPVLVLNTCQRLEVYGRAEPKLDNIRVAEFWGRQDAFERLARIASGLESRVLGELEVLGQVRNAYKEFKRLPGRSDTDLDRVFQEALALARRARRESGIDSNLTSLSGLASREVLGRIPTGAPVAVVGSGSLATSIIRYLNKRGESPVRVSSRCPEKAMALALEIGGFSSGLDQLSHLLDGVAGIICATAAPHPVLFTHHLDEQETPLVIADLGVPADCCEQVRSHARVQYLGLEDIEAKSMLNVEDRKARADKAARLIAEGACAWSLKQSK